MLKLKREYRRGKAFYVLRDNGKYLSMRKVKKGINKKELLEYVKRNKSLYKNVKYDKEKLTNVLETTKYITIKKDSKRKDLSKPNVKGVQFFVGFILKNGQIIYGRSNKLGTIGAETQSKAKAEAEENAFLRLGQYYDPGTYDIDTGRKYFKTRVTGVKRGWAWYTPV